MTVIGAGSYSIKSVNYNNDITVIKDNQDTDTNVSSSGINSKLDNAEAASDKSVDDVYADDEQVKEADKTPRHSDPKNFTRTSSFFISVSAFLHLTSRKGMNSILRVRLGIMKILMLVKRLQI